MDLATSPKLENGLRHQPKIGKMDFVTSLELKMDPVTSLKLENNLRRQPALDWKMDAFTKLKLENGHFSIENINHSSNYNCKMCNFFPPFWALKQEG